MNELPLYQIVDWNRYFENSKSRQTNNCRFVCVPNKHGGQGLMAVQNCGPELQGIAVYGAWVMLLEYCSRQWPPREGYLTTDGKRDGMRLCVAELARLIKVPDYHIRTTLRVLCSVGWLKLVDGKPEKAAADAAIPTAHVVNDANSDATADGFTDGNADGVSDGKSDLGQVNERRNEGKKESLSSGGIEEEESESDQDIEGFLPQMSPAPGSEPVTNPVTVCDTNPVSKSVTKNEPDVISVDELLPLASKLSVDVFGGGISEVQWRNQFESYAKEVCPYKREDWEYIDWAYRLPRTHKLLTVTRLRQSMLTLFQFLQSEPQKIRQARAAIGLNGLHDKPVERLEDNELTSEQVVTAKKIYGDDVSLPRKWGQLAPSVREKITAEMEVKS